MYHQKSTIVDWYLYSTWNNVVFKLIMNIGKTPGIEFVNFY